MLSEAETEKKGTPMRTCVFSGVPVEDLFSIHYVTKKFGECLSKQVCKDERSFSVARAFYTRVKQKQFEEDARVLSIMVLTLF